MTQITYVLLIKISVISNISKGLQVI